VRPRDDVLRSTRWASLAIVAILLPAVVVLWGLPGRTRDLWSWTIRPDMTAIFMGAGYGAGAYFFTRVAFGRRWHPAAAGVLASAVFAALMLIPTIIHYDRFNHGDAPALAAIAFYGWVAVYIAAPPAVFVLWWRNRRTDPGEPEPGEPLVPGRARMLARLVGVGALAAAAVFLIAPQLAIDVWAWKLTPLTARVLACFVAQVGLGALLLSFDARWGAWRLLLETFLVATVLLAAGTARAWDDLITARAGSWLYVGGLAAMALAVGALYVRMSSTASAPVRAAS
jgi:hypothetical protein